MKVYSDTLTRADLYAALPAAGDSIYLQATTIQRPRKRKHGYIVRLEALRSTGRFRNSGNENIQRPKGRTRSKAHKCTTRPS